MVAGSAEIAEASHVTPAANSVCATIMAPAGKHASRGLFEIDLDDVRPLTTFYGKL